MLKLTSVQAAIYMDNMTTVIGPNHTRKKRHFFHSVINATYPNNQH